MTRSWRGNEAADFDILRALAWVWLERHESWVPRVGMDDERNMSYPPIVDEACRKELGNVNS